MKSGLLSLMLLPFTLMAQTKITLEDIYKKGTFRAESVQGFNSLKDGRFYRETIAQGIIKKSFEDGSTVDTIIKIGDARNEKNEKLSLGDVQWSDDEKKIIIFVERESIYRRSSKAIAYVYDIATKKVSKIDSEKVLHASFSPDATKVAFIKNNNIFYKNLINNKTIAVTSDGKTNSIINGNCDWVYEEEFGFSKAYEWSSKGNFIAFYRFDESKVKEFAFTKYDSLYPSAYTYKYPKAGEANSSINIFVYNITNGKKIIADIGKEKDIYIPRIKFTNQDDQLSISWLNRLQNHLQLLKVNANTGKSSIYYQEKNKYYIETESANIEFLKDNKHFIMASEKQGYNQLYKMSLDGKTIVKLTKENYDITSVVGVDEANNIIYFLACTKSALTRDFCSVDLDGKNIKILNSFQGTITAKMSNDFSYCLQSFSTINNPTSYKMVNIKTGVERLLKDNQKLTSMIAAYSFGKVNFVKIPTSKGDQLNAWILKPQNFDSLKKYPVIMCNYGGPGSQQVADKWGAVNGWHQYLAQEGYVVVSVDNTGTGFRGEEFKKKTYLKLGTLEIEDQIDAAKYLASQSFIDGSRIGHWGWSFGGFMSSLAITKGAAIFKAAIAVAPVTSWRYYDNIYTERFMRTPQENKKGYDETAPINFVDKIKGKYLIIHGTADDNVHFQNSVMMIDEMIKKNIDFESSFYPNKNHSISGGNTSLHIYSKMSKFIFQNL